MAIQDYLDFDLRLERAGDGYRAVVVNAPAGHGAHGFVLPFTPDRLKVYQLEIGQRRSGVRRAESPGAAAAREFGGRLFEAVFGGEVRERWYQSLTEASGANRGLRLRLRLTDTPELADLPWEYLYDPRDREFLLLSAGTPLAHYLELPERIKPLAVQPPLRLLVMVSSPSDYEPLDVEKEWRQLREALAPLADRGLLVVDRLPRATLPALQSHLRKGEYHIFHFIGHGGFEAAPAPGEGILIVEDDAGRGRKVTGRDLAIYLKDEDTLRLAVLNCCEGARTSPTDLFAGVAQTLVRRSIPAVIAMQFEVSDSAAVTLAAEFYRALADGWPVDAALAEARKAVYGSGNAIEWGTPVLYLRAPDGRIFDVAPPAAPTAATRVAALVAEAGQAAGRGDWQAVHGKCEAALALDPGNGPATELLGRAREEQQVARDYTEGRGHLDAGRWEQAVASLQSVVRLRNGYRDAADLLARAKSRWRDNLVGPPPEVPRRPERIDPPPRPPRPEPGPEPVPSRPGRGGGLGGWLFGLAALVALAVVGFLVLQNSRGKGAGSGGGNPDSAAAREARPAPDPAGTAAGVAPGTPAATPALPPPVRPSPGWRVIAAGKEHDATDAELAAWIRERRVDADTLVRPQAGGDWTRIQEVPALASHLPVRPEPPPVRPAEARTVQEGTGDPAESTSPGGAKVGSPESGRASSRTARPARPAQASFMPASALGVGYWQVQGWEQDPGTAKRVVAGKVTFNAIGTFSMLFRIDGARRGGEGGWTYFTQNSRLQLTYPGPTGFPMSAQLQATTDGETVFLDGTNQGTVTHLELRPTTLEAVTQEVQDTFREALGLPGGDLE